MRFRVGDIDAIFRALRPRFLKLIKGGGSTSATETTVAPHTHHADTIGVEPAGDEWAGLIAADDVQEALQELDDEKLARSGVQPMRGTLNMDDAILGPYSINNIQSLHLTGGATEAAVDGVRKLDMSVAAVGQGVIQGPRAIHMAGDDADNEARVDQLDRVQFNATVGQAVLDQLSRTEWNVGVTPGTDYTASEGIASWSSAEDSFIAHVASGSVDVGVALGWDVIMAEDGVPE